jgi:hypothetical protein
MDIFHPILPGARRRHRHELAVIETSLAHSHLDLTMGNIFRVRRNMIDENPAQGLFIFNRSPHYTEIRHT